MAEWLGLERVALAPVAGRRVAWRRSGSVDHADFCRRAADWQAAFRARGETDWALYLDDVAEFMAALFGAWHAGKRVWLIGDDLPATLEGVAAHVQAYAGELPAALAPLHAPAGRGDGRGMQALDPHATRLVVFTSGSTGAPQAIDKQLCQLEREVESLEAVFGAGLGGARVHGTVSHQHLYGLLFRVLWPLAAGRPAMPRTFFHEELLSLPAQAPALLVTSPAHLKRLPASAAAAGRLRALFSSGGALPAAAARRAAALFGAAPVEILGSSETGGIAWRRWDGPAPAWQALPGVRWRLHDGLLVVDSPHLPPGTGDWRTEDRAEADGAGGFRLLGRADRIVKIEERRVSLDALEARLTAHPHVAEARVLVLDGARSVLAAVVVPTAAGAGCLRAHGRPGLRAILDAHLAASQDAVTRPRRWRFVDALPVDARGKTPRSALAALFRPSHPHPRWLQRGPAQAELELELTPDLPVFDGHFPQQAILPGVAQLDWAIRFGRDCFALPPRFLRLEAVKFQQVARPGQRLRLQLEWQAARSALAFRYLSDAGTHAGGRVVFGHEG